ncbi:MAG TPA: HAD hydrolase family protein [bacterium]|nr:HAD hydrolase family protein [bacterium]
MKIPSEIMPDTVERIRALKLMAFDFDGVFTDNMVYVSQDGSETVRCSRGDGLGLQTLRALGMELIIISTETNPVVSARAAKLGIKCVQSCGDKRAALEKAAKEIGAELAQAGFMGNDINDLKCLEAAGLPIVVSDAHPDVLEVAAYRTRARGGEGAVREVCDLIAAIKQNKTA